MELIIVLVLALVVLGPRRLPEAGRSLGRGMREFKQSLTGGDDAKRSAAAELDDSAAAEPVRVRSSAPDASVCHALGCGAREARGIP